MDFKINPFIYYIFGFFSTVGICIFSVTGLQRNGLKKFVVEITSVLGVQVTFNLEFKKTEFFPFEFISIQIFFTHGE